MCANGIESRMGIRFAGADLFCQTIKKSSTYAPLLLCGCSNPNYKGLNLVVFYKKHMPGRPISTYLNFLQYHLFPPLGFVLLKKESIANLNVYTIVSIFYFQYVHHSVFA